MQPIERQGSSLNHPFNAADQLFLGQEFQVYDPKSRECHTQFGKLMGCKVVFIAGRYQSGTLLKTENEFFKRFGEKGDCILLDTYAPGVAVPEQEVQIRWPALPPGVDVVGGDVRALGNKKELFRASRQTMHSIWASKVECIEKINALLQCMALFLNTALRNGSCLIREGEIHVEPQILKQLAPFVRAKSELFQRYNALQKKAIKISDEIGSFLIEKSNEGLADTIAQKVLEDRVKRIFVPWEMVHFHDMKALFKRMEAANIPYAILFPSTKKLCQVEEELGRSPSYELWLHFMDTDDAKIDITFVSSTILPYFDAEIGKLLKPSAVWLTPALLKNSPGVVLLPQASLNVGPIELNELYVDQSFVNPKICLEAFRKMTDQLSKNTQRQIQFEGGPITVALVFEPSTCKHYLRGTAVKIVKLRFTDLMP